MAEITESIIDFYRQANEGKLPVLSASPVVETVSIENEPIVESQPVLSSFEIKESFTSLEPTPIVEDAFVKFIEKFKTIVNEAKEKEPAAIIEREIKAKTLEFITKLKEGTTTKKPLPKKFIKEYPKPSKQKAIKTEIQENEISEEKLEDVVLEQEETPRLETKSQVKNNYVEQLRSLDKDKKKTETKSTDIKSLIDKKVKEAVEVLHKQLMNTAMGGSGGGTNAVQFAQGGTMRGDLNVTGNYLSGGVDLKDIFSGGGGGPIDRLTAGSKLLLLNPDGTFSFPDDLIKTENDSSLTLQSENTTLSAFTQVVVSPYAFIVHDNNQNSISFDTIDNTVTITTDGIYEWKFNDQGDLVGPGGVLTVEGSLNVSSHLLSGGRNLDEIFLTSETDAQTLSWNASAYNLSISNGNSVSLSSIKGREDINTLVSTNSAAWDQSYNTTTVYQANSASYATTQYTDATYLTLSGGTLTNGLSVFGSTFINNNLTVGGSLTALGTATFANTLFTTTSAISVVNTGLGPALYVYQAAGPYDVASFYDGDGIEVLHVGNAGPGGLGKVGINESFPNKELTVRGSISATETIYANSYLSAGVNLLDIFGSPADRLINGSYQVVLSSNGDLALPGAIVTASNSKLDLVGFGPNKAYLTTTPDDTTALFMGADVAELRAKTYASIATNTGGTTHLWEFGADGSLKFPDNTTQTTAFTGNPDGGGATPIKRFDYVTVSNIDYSYSGSAIFGTLDTSPTWKLIRLTYANNGTISNSASALNSWTGRLTATYV